MQQFYFNECFPTNVSKQLILERFCFTLKELNVLLENGLEIDRSIITEKPTEQMPLGDYENLNKLIEDIPNSNLRNFAYSVFIKSPIQDYFAADEVLVDEILSEDYQHLSGEIIYSGINMAISHANGAFLFTTATHPDLEADSLKCGPGKSGKTLEIDSLYGHVSNTSHIETQIKIRERSTLDLWDQLLAILGDAIYTSSFKRDFNSLTLAQQNSIIEGFKQAVDRKLASPFYPDTKLIADVTPQNSKSTVLELRVYTPTAVRVYFNEQNPKVFLVRIQKKSAPDQNKEIKQADLKLFKLIRTGA